MFGKNLFNQYLLTLAISVPLLATYIYFTSPRGDHSHLHYSGMVGERNVEFYEEQLGNNNILKVRGNGGLEKIFYDFGNDLIVDKVVSLKKDGSKETEFLGSRVKVGNFGWINPNLERDNSYQKDFEDTIKQIELLNS